MSGVSRSRWFGVGAAALVVASFAFARGLEEVDFDAPRKKGLKYKLTEAVKGRMAGKISMNGEEVDIEQEINSKEVFTETVLDVKDGKITQLLREYEEAGEDEAPSPLAWKTFRAEWNDDDELSLRYKDGDAWKKADDTMRAFLNNTTLLHPTCPTPKGKKSVGDTWEVTEKQFKEYFPPARFGYTDAEVEGEFNLKLASIAEFQKMKCAVIEFQTEVTVSSERTSAMTIKVKGKAHYSLDHRIFVGMTGTGTLTLETPAMSGEFKVSQTVKIAETMDG
jgi:hypothetical protein